MGAVINLADARKARADKRAEAKLQEMLWLFHALPPDRKRVFENALRKVDAGESTFDEAMAALEVRFCT